MKPKSIPVIDIRRLDSPDSLRALDRACREWGFFQAVNHGIPKDAIARTLEEARGFFARSREFKRQVIRTPENPWGFYDRELTKNAVDLKEIFDFGPSDGDCARPQWPPGMPGFQAAMRDHYRQNERVSFRILAAISMNLGMSPGYLNRQFGRDHTSFMRLNYYPVAGAAGDEATAGRLGVGQHTDSGALTLLLQDTQPGLEVFKDSRWHLVDPIPGALVVNIGDMVQVWSNDHYFAALHRVVASKRKPRFSIPFFLNPPYRLNYAPLPTTVSDDRPPRYQQINWGEFRRRRVAGDYADYGVEVQIDQYRKPA
jgi:isopenicillin N synthase-like dioxygenase